MPNYKVKIVVWLKEMVMINEEILAYIYIYVRNE